MVSQSLAQRAYARAYLVFYGLATVLSFVGFCILLRKPAPSPLPPIVELAFQATAAAAFLVAAITVRRGLPRLSWSEQSVLVGPLLVLSAAPITGAAWLLELAGRPSASTLVSALRWLPLIAGWLLHLVGLLAGTAAVIQRIRRETHLTAWFYVAYTWNAAVSVSFFVPVRMWGAA